MDKIKYNDKNNDIYNMYLSELKNELYINKKLTNKNIDKIKNLINNKIKNSLIYNKINNIDNNINTDDIEVSSISISDELSSEESEEEYKNEISKIYNIKDKKGENQKFTQTSQKLYNRMMSHAEVINNTYNYKNNYNNKIIKPFVDRNTNNNLGIRKNIQCSDKFKTSNSF